MLTVSLPLEEPSENLISRFSAQQGFTVLASGGGEPLAHPYVPLARWSFIAVDPFLVFSFYPGAISIRPCPAGVDLSSDPLQTLENLLLRYKIEEAAPTPFPAGAVGFLSYELRTLVEKVPATGTDDLGLPHLRFCFYDAVLSIDHYEKRIWLTSTGLPFEGEARLARQQERIDTLLGLLRRQPASGRGVGAAAAAESPLFSSLSRPRYIKAIKQVKEYIAAGDVYQVNIAQRFSIQSAVEGFPLFGRLQRSNPSPFAAYLPGEGFTVVSSSPERFLHYDALAGIIHTRPIKGTRPRGANPHDDERLARELLASEKDHAEHVMIVDLERNDLGRIAATGSVHVPEFCVLETFPTVFHLTSTVEAVLPPGTGPAAILRATFPGGSITGAPKVRAMEIIDEIEPVARGIYTGAIGYLSFNGNIDLNIVIRTLVLSGGYVHFHVGGGIVADSDPEEEYQETLDKGLAFSRVLGLNMHEVIELESIR